MADGVVSAAPEVLGTVAQCPVVDFPRPAPEKINRRQLMNGYPHEEVSPSHADPKLFRSVLVAQGDADETTPLEHARAFVERLRAAEVDARLEVIAGAGHGYGYDTLSDAGKACLAKAVPYVKELFSR